MPTCKQCQREFRPRNGNQKYCGTYQCYWEHKKGKPIPHGYKGNYWDDLKQLEKEAKQITKQYQAAKRMGLV
jgi:hypothetical protein